MRILNVESPVFAACFRKLGHEVLTLGPYAGCDVRVDRPYAAKDLFALLRSRAFWPDLALWVDSCRPPSVLGLELLPCVTIGYSIDQYCNPWHVPWSASFDCMLLAQKSYQSVFSLPHLPRDVEWFPLFFDPTVLDAKAPERAVPVSFVGTVSGSINTSRRQFLDAVRAVVPVVVRQGTYAPVYARSMLVLNQSAAGEVNFRVFEGAGCGALVVTEESMEGLDELFVVGEEIATYTRGNAAHAASVCRVLLADVCRLNRMAEAGRRRVLREHTVNARARRILTLARTLAARRSWEWRARNATLIQRELGKMCVFLGTDHALPLPADMAEGYARMGIQRLIG